MEIIMEIMLQWSVTEIVTEMPLCNMMEITL